MEGTRESGPDEGCQDSKKVNNRNNYNSFTQVGPTTNKQFLVLYTNADCLCNKREDLEFLLNTMAKKPDIIAIFGVNSKSIKSKMYEMEFSLNGYNIFGKNVGNSKYRGILMYIHDKIQVTELDIQNNLRSV